ncbi:TPM domain-containing protein, partial [Acinetobacter baumannii]
TTAPEVIDAYSIRVADAWKLGRKGVDDGVILIVARDNPKELRRLRIEAGRGVQGVMTDVQSKRILADIIAPHFKQNDFYGGLTAGVTAIMQVL